MILENSGDGFQNVMHVGNRFWNCHYGISGANVYKFNSEYNIFRSTQSYSSLPTFNFVPQGQGAIGISSNRFQYLVRYNEFTNISQCINFPLASGAYSTVASGTATGIYASLIGIVQNTFSPGTGANNYISNAVNISCVNAFTPVVITNTNVSPPASGIVIEDNHFSDVYRAINVNGITGLHNEIKNNTIRLVPDNYISSTQYGIKVTNGISATSSGFYTSVHQNDITGVGTATPNPNEALVYSGLNTGLASPSICCNVVGNGYTGFKIAGNNPGTIWAGNVMDPLSRGLELFNNGVMGQQGHSLTASHNQWQGSWVQNINFGTWVDGGNVSLNIPSSNAAGSQLYVSSTYTPPENGGSVGPQDQFNLASGHLKITTGGDYNCGGNPNNIVIPVLDHDTYPAGTMYSIAENLLYRFLRLDQDSKDALGHEVQNFYDGLEGGKTETLMDIEHLLYQGDYAGARALNEDFEAEEDNLCEETYSEYYRIYANYLESIDDGTFLMTESDSVALFYLASLCPENNGPAVYQARALINHKYGYIEFDGCEGYSADRKANRQIEDKIQNDPLVAWTIRMYPNPASDQIEFETSGEGKTLEVTVLDVSGRKVFEMNVALKDNHAKMPVNLSQGLYFIHIQSSSNESTIKKVVIAK